MKSNETEILSFDGFESKEQKDFESFMMRYKSEFRDFKKVGDFTYSNILTSIAYDSYLAGQQSKQDEVDELKMGNHNLSVMVAEAESYSEYWKYERDKLQKRLDEINNHLEINYDENRDDDSHSYWSGYNQALRELFEILKGNTNEH